MNFLRTILKRRKFVDVNSYSSLYEIQQIHVPTLFRNLAYDKNLKTISSLGDPDFKLKFLFIIFRCLHLKYNHKNNIKFHWLRGGGGGKK